MYNILVMNDESLTYADFLVNCLSSQRSWSCTTRASYQYSCMVRTAGRYLRRMHARSMHSTSGVYVSLPSGRLEKTTRSSPHHMAQHRPTGSETTPPYAPGSSRFGSEPPSVEDDVDVWCYAIVRVACQKRRHTVGHFWYPTNRDRQTVIFTYTISATGCNQQRS